ncbi:hypothetical protein OEA41_005157 [Lepraria neglecta]|uniref:Uncharacterized protein n=1 Tax=Lepraria neglecta TaxID=209136 RepID=A0AAD9YZ86_9LECA|nr:hypothetical protein OEA41_005157 [Lepraria neglecta]
MPSKHHPFSRSNRSQASLGNPEAYDKRSYGDSPLHSPAFPPQSAPLPRYDDGEEEQSYSIPNREEEANYYRLSPTGHPTRSQSQRAPSLINTNQPTIHLVAPHSSSSTPSSAIEDNPDRYYQQGPPPPVHKVERKKRSFFGLGSSSSTKDSGRGTSGTSQKLGRSISVRRKEQVDPQVYADTGNRGAQERWSSKNLAAEEAEDEEEGGAGLRTGHRQYNSGSPHPPDKDPLKSPAFPPPVTHEEYISARSQQQGGVSNTSNRHTLERQGSYQSSWEKAAQQVTKHSRGESAQQQTPSSYHPSPSSATSTSSQPFLHRAPHEESSQNYQDQNSRPPSQQSLDPPQPAQRPRTLDFYQSKKERNQAASGTHIQGSMGPPPPQQPPPNRRSSESAQQSQTGSQGREGGVYQPYNQNVQQGQILPSNAPPQYSSQLAPQGQTYRGGSQPSPMAPGNEQGRSTPPPSRSRDDLSELNVSQLLARHDELQDKYRKVKKYYFDKDAQVQQLQNTLAHQRLSQSRTSLDDNEYANRFQRLDGAINNLAFNIRRDWRSIPPWLAPHVNRDAITQPTKEMTAVGRACIARWLVDEIFERFFHPAVEPGFSSQLKIIELNLRRRAAPTPSDEEKDALMARISNWRLATLDGLHEAMNSPQAAEYRASLTENLVEKLTACLSMFLKEPAPPGLEGSVSMIVELAVGIAANLPMESRDVFVEFVHPGTLIQETVMKIETGLPALTNPGDGLAPEGDTASMASKKTEETGSIESKETGTSNGNSNEEATAKQEAAMPQQQAQQQQQQAAQGKKKGMFGGFMNSAGSKKGSIGGGPPSQQPPPQAPAQQQQGPPKEDRVRFSTFMVVEVRGRSVLVKAPVYLRE